MKQQDQELTVKFRVESSRFSSEVQGSSGGSVGPRLTSSFHYMDSINFRILNPTARSK